MVYAASLMGFRRGYGWPRSTISSGRPQRFAAVGSRTLGSSSGYGRPGPFLNRLGYYSPPLAANVLTELRLDTPLLAAG